MRTTKTESRRRSLRWVSRAALATVVASILGGTTFLAVRFEGVYRNSGVPPRLAQPDLELRVHSTPPCELTVIEPIPFDAEVWKCLDSSDPERLRYRMLDDLFTSQGLLGKSAPEIQNLLGPLKWGRESGRGFRYFYRLERGFRVTDLWIRLDEDERVVEVSLGNDPGYRPLLPAGYCRRHHKFEQVQTN
jgi:hypothetical protein